MKTRAMQVSAVVAIGLMGTGPGQTVRREPLSSRAESKGGRLFVELEPEATGLAFAYGWNPPVKYDHEMVNAVTGGGVCLGDYDGDGLTDVFLTQPFNGNRLYRNKGHFRFEDVTEKAGLAKEHLWGTGASFADIDNDGDRDLFVCGYDCANRLYLNQGDGTFTENAEGAGLSYHGASVMVAFADYDLDGDLDAYLCNNHFAPREAPFWKYEKDARGMPIVPPELKGKAKPLYRPGLRAGKLIPAGETDRLYRNNGDGTFTDVSNTAGIADEDFGLSATWWDFDHDGYPDLYNANDFYGADHLYRNNGDGTFSEVNRYALPHTPWFSMGSDVADVNNDGWLDFIASDMQGSTHYRQKISMGDMQGWFLETAIPRQYMRNALYINTGTLRFQEAAFMAGVESTDWTWSLKFGDLDNDGWQDLYVTNGAERYWDHSDLMKSARGAQRIDTPELKRVWLPSPVRNDPNLAFRNGGDLQFENVSEAWGLGAERVSYGAAFSDLDGDLDLVTNNFDSMASVYRNEGKANHLALLRLRGVKSNRHGLGAMIRVTTHEGRQTLYHTLTRGFMSANDDAIHVGLGPATQFDLEIEWPSGARQRLSGLKAGFGYWVREKDTGEKPPGREKPMFVLSPALKDAKQTERPFDDFAREPLLPNRLSQLGPGMAWGDVDGDGDDDVFIGGPAGRPGTLYQTRRGSFEAVHPAAWQRDAGSEDMAPLLLDVDGDGDLDLFVVSGGVEHDSGAEELRDRLYLNDGKGRFTRAPDSSLPDLRFSGGVAAAADYDGDGDLDIFIGGRVIPGRYPETPPSVLLRNDGGRFTDVTTVVAPELGAVGLVTSALWSDVDDDGWLDLLLTREWSSVALFRNEEGVLNDRTTPAGLAGRLGWWNGIAAADLDHDRDMDYVVTNTGLNTKYSASGKRPARLYFGDMDGSGRKQLVEAKVGGKSLYPVRGKMCSQGAMPHLEKKFPTFESFASATLSEIYTSRRLSQARVFEANELQSGALINDGRGKFSFRPLPRMAQLSPGYGCALTEVDGDGHPDLYLAQNSHGAQPETGHMDGGVSQLLLGRGDGTWSAVPPYKSGLMIPGAATSLAPVDLNGDGWVDFVVATNSGPVFTFLQTGTGENQPLALRFRGLPGNPSAVGLRATLALEDGSTQTAEVSAGGGYLSQHSGMLFFGARRGASAKWLRLRWPDGKRSVVNLTQVKGRRLEISHPSLAR